MHQECGVGSLFIHRILPLPVSKKKDMRLTAALYITCDSNEWCVALPKLWLNAVQTILPVEAEEWQTSQDGCVCLVSASFPLTLWCFPSFILLLKKETKGDCVRHYITGSNTWGLHEPVVIVDNVDNKHFNKALGSSCLLTPLFITSSLHIVMFASCFSQLGQFSPQYTCK